MNTNIIRAIINLVKTSKTVVSKAHIGRNRINNMGEALEKYVKDLFSNTVLEIEKKRISRQSALFSYLGNQNNPPDAILRNGDAIEIKKIGNQRASLALNSSYPKAKLFADSPMITKACKSCENWVEKDIIYAIGTVDKNDKLSFLSFVYGVDYAANSEIYERIKKTIKNGILDIDEVEFSETKELGRVNKVDPLGITNLRIRGMWHIENPIKVFDYVYTPIAENQFNFMSIINEDKFNSFSSDDLNELYSLAMSNTDLSIKDVKIKDPNNPANLKRAKLIEFFIKEA